MNTSFYCLHFHLRLRPLLVLFALRQNASASIESQIVKKDSHTSQRDIKPEHFAILYHSAKTTIVLPVAKLRLIDEEQRGFLRKTTNSGSRMKSSYNLAYRIMYGRMYIKIKV